MVHWQIAPTSAELKGDATALARMHEPDDGTAPGMEKARSEAGIRQRIACRAHGERARVGLETQHPRAGRRTQPIAIDRGRKEVLPLEAAGTPRPG